MSDRAGRDQTRHGELELDSCQQLGCPGGRIPRHDRALHVPREGRGRVERELRRHAVARGRIEPIAEHLRHHEHVGVGLKPGRNRPQHLLLVEDVDILVDRDHEFEVRIEAKQQHQGMARLAVRGLLHRHVSMEVRAGFWKAQCLEVRHHLLEAHVHMRLKEMVPNLKALSFPKSGTHFHAYMSMKKTADGQPRHALMLLLGLDPYLKFVVAVDEDVNVFDEEEVLWAIATRFQADADMFMVPNVFCNRLDPSSRDGMSAKLALDATAPLKWDVQRARVPCEAAAMAAELLARF